MEVDLSRIRPYGDTLDDGYMQLSFTLPVQCDAKAKKAAELLSEKMGLRDVKVVYAHNIGDSFSFFIVYGRCIHSVDMTAINIPEVDVEFMSYDEINEFIEKHIGRKVVVVAACTGTDA
ncbi:MAG: OAM dimerization domain-containing protein, partial [Bacillota bacterium]